MGAYAVVVDGGQVLLAHWASRGIWTVPGGGIDPGEDPRDAAVREVAEETGYDVALDALLGVDSEVVPSVRAGAPDWHALRVVYRAHVTGGALRDEVDGSTDRAAWFPLDAVADLPSRACWATRGPGEVVSSSVSRADDCTTWRETHDLPRDARPAGPGQRRERTAARSSASVSRPWSSRSQR